MDPVSIIAAVIGLIETISNAYKIIGKIADLPEAFREVEKHLPLVQETLSEIRQLDTTTSQRQSVLKILDGCQTKAKELERIFTELEKRCKQDQGAKGWGRVRAWYRDALQGIKGHRVETLMKEILMDLEKLAVHETLGLGGKLEDIKKAVNELAKVEPSLNEEFESRTQNAWHVKVEKGGYGQMNAPYGGTNNTHNYSLGTTNHYASHGPDYLQALFLVDPSEDKHRIKPENGVRRDSFSWVFNDKAFRAWRERKKVQLLWITGGAGKGKSTMLCGIIEELKSETHALSSYFFCNSEEKTSNSAVAVLRGLIWLLAVQMPSLESHIKEKYKGAGKQLFEDHNAFQALSGILSQMLKDKACKACKNKYLIVDAAEQCASDLDRLLEFVGKSFGVLDVKWIISGRRACPPNLRQSEKNSRQIDLDGNDSVSAAVDRYIGQTLIKLDWLKPNPELFNEAQQIMRRKANSRFEWVALLREDLPSEDASSLLRMLKDAPTNISDVKQVKKLLDEGYKMLENFQIGKSSKGSESLYQSLEIASGALKGAEKMDPRYKIGMFQANILLAECNRELSHRSRFTPEQKLDLIKAAERHADAALSLAQETGNRECCRRAEFEKAIMKAMTAALASRAARHELATLKEEYEEEGNQPRVKRARIALEQLRRALEDMV